MNQKIDGDNNIQVGRVDGALNIGSDDPLDPNNPNLIECPSCWKLASRAASPCPRCGYNILAHFAAIEREERRKLVIGRAVLCGVVFIGAGILSGVSWLPQSLKGTFAFAAVGAALMGAAFLSAADKLK